MSTDTLPAPPTSLAKLQYVLQWPHIHTDDLHETAARLHSAATEGRADEAREHARSALDAYQSEWGDYERDSYPQRDLEAFDSHEHQAAWMGVSIALLACAEPQSLGFLLRTEAV